ncbi:MAG: hypothetical protein RL398_3544 [Planctomycetota bacterium]
MNDTIKAILSVLEAGKPELQVAAAQILGELRAKEPPIVRALGIAIGRSPVLGRFALDALAKIGSAAALGEIATWVSNRDTLGEHAALLLADAGEAAHSVLTTAFAAAAPEVRTRILSILAKTPSKAGIPIFVEALLAPTTAEGAAALLMDATAAANGPWQEPLRAALAKALGGGLAAMATLPEAAQARLIDLLRHLDPVGAKPVLVKLTGAEHPSLVRGAAMRSLRGGKLTAAQVQELMALLEDPAQKDLHDAARDVLAELPELPAAMIAPLKRLLTARQPEQRLFALRMLRTVGGAEMAKVGIKYLAHDDARFRAAALAALAANKQAVEPVAKVLLSAHDLETQAAAASILRQAGAHVAPRLLKSMLEKAVKLLASNARLGDLVLDTVIAIGGIKIAPAVIEKAVRMRRARRPAEALHLLAKVASLPAAPAEARYQLAVTNLQRTRPQETAEHSPGDPTMGFFAMLVRDGFPLFARITKEASVSGEDLLRIATHFARGVGAERRFGSDLLQHLATRTKGAASEDAKLALRSAMA